MMLEGRRERGEERENKREREREKKIWQIHKAVWLHCGHVAASTTTLWPYLTFSQLLTVVFFFWTFDPKNRSSFHQLGVDEDFECYTFR